MKKLIFVCCLFVAAVLCGCAAKNGVDFEGGKGDYSEDVGPVPSGDVDGDIVSPDFDGEGGEGGDVGDPNGNEQGSAGRVTAGEWRDLDNWLFWSNLMTNKQADQEGSDFTEYSEYWGLFTNNRVAVRVTDKDGKPVKDMSVQVVPAGQSKALFEGRTDNKGEVNLWIGLTQKQEADGANLGLLVGNNGEQAVKVTHWGEEVVWNEIIVERREARGESIDIAFIVDATGSMTDEIDFLKADLTNIITTVQSKYTDASIRTSALFYRDEGDDYLTRVSDFTSTLSETVSFIKDQRADGGGDYPEAVHTALEVGLQKLSWKEDGCIRLAFMLLDAPPHKQADVIASLQKSIPLYAKQGIRIIPVAASGVDKPTEFFLRFTALATDATYVFLTNHSGIGNDHIAATVGDYKVEQLNELIVRLIGQYLE